MLADFLGAFCVLFVVAGVAMIYVPVAVILLGVGCGGAAYYVGSQESKGGPS